MLVERTVRRLSIRAADDARVRHAAFLIEDALRTASLPGDGADLLLLRRLRLPPFAAGASAQQVALRLEAACRGAIAVDGATADDAALAAAAAVRFADALTAHLALSRLILAGASRQAWCWPMVVKAYRPPLGSAAALRTVALSLAQLPEAPAALPRWVARLVAHGGGACGTLLLALDGEDAALLRGACRGALKLPAPAAPARWQSLLDWSVRGLGAEDTRHLWLLDMARLCGVAVDRHVGWPRGAQDDGRWGPRGPLAARGEGIDRPDRHDQDDRPARPVPAAADERSGENFEAAPAARSPEDGSGDQERTRAGLDATAAAPPRERTAWPGETRPAISPVMPELPNRRDPASAVATGATARERQAPAPAASDGRPVVSAGDLPGTFGEEVAEVGGDLATAAGGLLFLVPLLTRLGVVAWLAEDAARIDLPRRLFATLLQRLPITDADPAWWLCGGPPARDRPAVGDALHWLGRCRRHLRLQVGIGLHSLVCRPARITLTATHVDVRQAIDDVDLRVRRAGLDLDPGWVPWLGRVLRFHYASDRR
ncbi:hypothetical protein [Accumulibacter sp.]|uniref:hypothetical protein n=1 Tax=Accumulibacter sp. TaxID=2053492 RepID=UPI00260EC397|nr:hypothetical protein [Accumulibacter sp.]